jgi:hypothetical protein
MVFNVESLVSINLSQSYAICPVKSQPSAALIIHQPMLYIRLAAQNKNLKLVVKSLAIQALFFHCPQLQLPQVFFQRWSPALNNLQFLEPHASLLSRHQCT